MDVQRDRVLESAALQAVLAEHPDWRLDGASLKRTLQFADFSEAFGFMTRVALTAERLDHHPDWSNSWNRVEVAVTSHDQGGVTGRCVELVAAIDRLVAESPR